MSNGHNFAASPNEWILKGSSLLHNSSASKFPNLPSLNDISHRESAGLLLITATRDLHIYVYYNRKSVQRVATGLPVNQQLWGIVDVHGKVTMVKSEMLSGKLGGVCLCRNTAIHSCCEDRAFSNIITRYGSTLYIGIA